MLDETSTRTSHETTVPGARPLRGDTTVPGARPDRSETAVPGARLAWNRTGGGPAAVWAHPLCSSSLTPESSGAFDWSPVAAAGRSLVRYDARGHGRSTGAPTPEDFRFPVLARDLLALLDVISPHAPVAGIGLSLGTATLLHAAVLAPHRFDRLVLTAPPTAWETRPQQAAAYTQLADLVEEHGASVIDTALAAAPVPAPYRDAPGFPFPVEVDEHLLPSVLRGAAASDLPPKDSLARLRLPVLILPWAGDPGHPLSTAETLASLIPGAQTKVAHHIDDLRAWGTDAAEFLRP
ncbi:alpha/beta fold hydrolase [Streptomyces sp. NPDC021080]|uniref:alpha/beta fold hydrolase n=1 Tax=Streptomyces sp. NPDC021080 TaxID=3365110 RepID=UPI0037A2C2E0